MKCKDSVSTAWSGKTVMQIRKRAAILAWRYALDLAWKRTGPALSPSFDSQSSSPTFLSLLFIYSFQGNQEGITICKRRGVITPERGGGLYGARCVNLNPPVVTASSAGTMDHNHQFPLLKCPQAEGPHQFGWMQICLISTEPLLEVTYL